MGIINKIKLFIYLRFKVKANGTHFSALPSIGDHVKITIKNGSIKWGKANFIDEYGMVRTEKGEIILGNDVRLKRYSVISSRYGVISLGNHCRLHDFSIIQAGSGGVKIGNSVRIAPHVKIFAENHVFDLIDEPFYKQGMTSKGITIGDNVWIGTGTIILDGVTIGNNVVIGAGSVVTKSIESDSIAAGNPAKVLKKLI